MKVLSINVTNFGSTGNIMLQIQKEMQKQGDEMLCCISAGRECYKRFKQGQYLIGNIFERRLHIAFTKITGYHGCFSVMGTGKLLHIITRFKPDIIHLHNLHESYINLPMLFWYIKKHSIQVVWTFHDCWSFTGHCPHFAIAKCDKWKQGCHDCTQYRGYPASYVDQSDKMWGLKKKWFTGIRSMTLVSPSEWLSQLVSQSYLGGYDRKVIHNGIDLEIFKPTRSHFRKKHGIGEKEHVVLGVAFGWNYKKGLDVFIKLSHMLGKDYRIVLVGTSDRVDKKLPDKIISIHRTHDQKGMAQIYTAADVFVNPTREDNYPTVNMEAIACGTPVLTFKTGGSPEILDENSGLVIPVNDIFGLKREIVRICEERPFTEASCLARAKDFDMNICFGEYVALYKSMLINQ